MERGLLGLGEVNRMSTIMASECGDQPDVCVLMIIAVPSFSPTPPPPMVMASLVSTWITDLAIDHSQALNQDNSRVVTNRKTKTSRTSHDVYFGIWCLCVWMIMSDELNLIKSQ